jgi:hypothetical protein
LRDWLNETLKKCRPQLERKALTRANLPLSVGINIDSDVFLDLEPLRKMGLDKATLESYNMSAADMRRLYRGLYVSS